MSKIKDNFFIGMNVKVYGNYKHNIIKHGDSYSDCPYCKTKHAISMDSEYGENGKKIYELSCDTCGLVFREVYSALSIEPHDYPCMVCGNPESHFLTNDNEEEGDGYICIGCLRDNKATRCESCNSLFVNSDDSTKICNECQGKYNEYDIKELKEIIIKNLLRIDSSKITHKEFSELKESIENSVDSAIRPYIQPEV